MVTYLGFAVRHFNPRQDLSRQGFAFGRIKVEPHNLLLSKSFTNLPSYTPALSGYDDTSYQTRILSARYSKCGTVLVFALLQANPGHFGIASSL